MPYQIILNVILLFGAAIFVIIVSKKLKIPPVIGFVLTGLIWSALVPTALQSNRELNILSEFGIVFLLFMLGLDFSPEKVRRLGRTMLIGGSVQAVLTTGAALIFVFLGFVPFAQAILLSFIIIQSSTAIALKVYQDRGEINAPQAETSIGISLFQDISTVLLLILIPIIGADLKIVGQQTFLFAGRSILILAAFTAAAYWVFPLVLRWVVISGIRELVVLLALVFCLGFSILSQSLGFSMALGAFICGILLNRSEYHAQIFSDTSPFRDIFLSLFFISIGLGYNWKFAMAHFTPILLITVAVIASKTVILFISTRAVGYPFRISLLTGIGLSNIGEFGFVVMVAATPYGLLTDNQYLTIASVAIYSMLLTPVLIIGISKLTIRFNAYYAKDHKTAKTPPDLQPKIVIVGYGLAGQHLSRVLKASAIPYMVIESNGHNASIARSKGEFIFFGDASRWDVLERSGFRAAQILVVLISDPAAMRACISIANRQNRNAAIICRARRMDQIDSLLKAGADEVISEEFETSIELFTRVLDRLHVPRNIIRTETRLLRAESYEMLRVPAPASGISNKLVEILSEGTTDVFQVMQDHFTVDKTLVNLELRNKTGVSVISVVRGDKTIMNPPPDLQILSGDSLVLVGSHAQVESAFNYLENGQFN